MSSRSYQLGYKLAADTEQRQYNIRVGSKNKWNEEDFKTFLRRLENRNSVDLSSAPILLNKYEPVRELIRQRIPQRWNQVPSRLGTLGIDALSIAGAPFTMGTSLLLEIPSLTSAMLPPDNYYRPNSGSVSLTSKNKGIAAHELGHWLDYELNQSPYKRGWFSRENAPFKSSMLNREIAATLFARRGLTPTEWKQNRNMLAAGLHSYMEAQAFMSFVEKNKKNSGQWKKAFLKAKTPKERQTVIMAAFKSISDVHDWEYEQPFRVDPESGRLIWNNSDHARKAREFILKLLELEQKRLDSIKSKSE